MMIDVGDPIVKGEAGDRTGARTSLSRLWAKVGEDGDPFFRCAIAHSLADVQEDPEEELKWDLLAMKAGPSLTDERLIEGGVEFKVEGFLPSLHLNLADDYLKMGQHPQAQKHLSEGRTFLVFLGGDGYRQMIEGAFDRIDTALISSTTLREFSSNPD